MRVSFTRVPLRGPLAPGVLLAPRFPSTPHFITSMIGNITKSVARDIASCLSPTQEQVHDSIHQHFQRPRPQRPSESFGRIDLQMGQVVSIVGPTGSGKTTLINDIELFADGDTPSGRRVLIDGKPTPTEFRYNPACNPIALITQHTTFLSDLPVREFLLTHSRVRTGGGEDPELVEKAIEFANKLTGEPIDMDNRMTELSGGQTRRMLIADATVICSTPVVLLDEVENAGHPPHPGGAVVARVPQDLHFRDTRPADGAFVRFPHRDAGWPGYTSADDQRRGARGVVARQSAGRRAFRPARAAADGRAVERRGTRRIADGRAIEHRGTRRTTGGGMRVAIVAGPATTGKTSVIRHSTRKLLQAGHKTAFLKLDVQYADEDEMLAKEFGIPTRNVYSGELCPDHCNVMVLGDGLRWAEQNGCDTLMVETAGLCLRCSPYVDGGLGLVVLEATSGMNLPLKVGPMLSLADVAVVTKIDRISQAEREVFRARIQDVAPQVRVREVNALHRHRHRSAGDRNPRFPRDRRPAVSPRQSAGGNFHDLRRQEGNRLGATLRRGSRAGKSDVLSRRVNETNTR